MSGGAYLAVAYVVVLAAVLVYVAIIALKLSRLDQDLEALARQARRPREEGKPDVAGAAAPPDRALAGSERGGAG